MLFRSWKSSAVQLNLELNLHPADASIPIYLTFFRPPVRQDMYFKTATNPNGPIFGLWGNNDKIFYHYEKMTTLIEVRGMFLVGLATIQLKQWLLYSFPAALDSGQ